MTDALRPAHFCARCGQAYWWVLLPSGAIIPAELDAAGAVTVRAHGCGEGPSAR